MNRLAKQSSRITGRRNVSAVAYLTGFGAINAGSLLSSPVGTALGSVLSYNMGVVGNNHINYTMDLFYKDYVQDPVIYATLKQLTALCMVLLIGQLFVQE